MSEYPSRKNLIGNEGHVIIAATGELKYGITSTGACLCHTKDGYMLVTKNAQYLDKDVPHCLCPDRVVSDLKRSMHRYILHMIVDVVFGLQKSLYLATVSSYTLCIAIVVALTFFRRYKRSD